MDFSDIKKTTPFEAFVIGYALLDRKFAEDFVASGYNGDTEFGYEVKKALSNFLQYNAGEVDMAIILKTISRNTEESYADTLESCLNCAMSHYSHID